MIKDNDIKDSTKVSTETEFQPTYTFIMRSGRAMIYHVLNNLFLSVKGFCRFWSLELEDVAGTGEETIDEDEIDRFFNWVRGNNRYCLVV